MCKTCNFDTRIFKNLAPPPPLKNPGYATGYVTFHFTKIVLRNSSGTALRARFDRGIIDHAGPNLIFLLSF